MGVKGLISFQKNKKSEESKQGEQSKQLLKIKLQLICYLRNKQTRKQNKGEQKTNKCCTRSWLKTVENKNDPAKLNYKSQWIKFTVKNLYQWYKHR